MAVTATSKESYKKLTDLGPRQLAVHSAIGNLGIASNREIALYLNIGVNQVTGRVKELRDYGFVVEHGKKWDRETQRNVTAWCTSDPYAQKKIDLAKDTADEIEPDKWKPQAIGWMYD